MGDNLLKESPLLQRGWAQLPWAREEGDYCTFHRWVVLGYRWVTRSTGRPCCHDAVQQVVQAWTSLVGEEGATFPWKAEWKMLAIVEEYLGAGRKPRFFPQTTVISDKISDNECVIETHPFFLINALLLFFLYLELKYRISSHLLVPLGMRYRIALMFKHMEIWLQQKCLALLHNMNFWRGSCSVRIIFPRMTCIDR